jgi:hypothetical protein
MTDVLLGALVPIFAVMGLGYFAGWMRHIDNHHVAELNALVMDFAVPAALFDRKISTAARRTRTDHRGSLFSGRHSIARFCKPCLPTHRTGIRRCGVVSYRVDPVIAAAAYPDMATRSCDDFRSLQGARAWLERVSADELV